MKYRKLDDNEVIQEGDQCSGSIGGPHTHAPGGHVHGYTPKRWNAEYKGHYDFYRPVKEHNWISFKDRRPTKKDASPAGNVAVRCDGGGVSFMNLARGQTAIGTHWMPLNFIPDEPARIKVDGKEIVPQKDGSVKLSCGTIIPKEGVKEFIRQYNEVTK